MISHRHPATSHNTPVLCFFVDLLETIFYALSEADLISDDSFHQWKRKNSSGIAIQSVSPFFKWLEETEDDN